MDDPTHGTDSWQNGQSKVLPILARSDTPHNLGPVLKRLIGILGGLRSVNLCQRSGMGGSVHLPLGEPLEDDSCMLSDLKV